MSIEGFNFRIPRDERARAIAGLDRIERPGLILNPAEIGTVFGGRRAHLTPTQFLICYALAQEPGRYWTKDELAAFLDRGSGAPAKTSMHVHITQLRDALRQAHPWPSSCGQPIQNKRKLGWCWVDWGSPGFAPPLAGVEAAAAAPPAERSPGSKQAGPGAATSIEGLTAQEAEVVERARKGQMNMTIARDLRLPLPRVHAILTKARHLGISTTEG